MGKVSFPIPPSLKPLIKSVKFWILNCYAAGVSTLAIALFI